MTAYIPRHAAWDVTPRTARRSPAEVLAWVTVALFTVMYLAAVAA